MKLHQHANQLRDAILIHVVDLENYESIKSRHFYIFETLRIEKFNSISRSEVLFLMMRFSFHVKSVPTWRQVRKMRTSCVCRKKRKFGFSYVTETVCAISLENRQRSDFRPDFFPNKIR